MSILLGLARLFDQHLGVGHIGTRAPHYQHRTSALELSKGPPPGFSGYALLDAAYTQLAANLECSPRFARKGPSPENWRFEKQLHIAERNASAETRLERAIAAAAGPDWVNQVPAASGLWDHVADKRRAVDLVHRRAPGCYELIELKVESDTPLRAAVEVVEYALLYLLARDRMPAWQRTGEILAANEVHARVLAPSAYYARFRLGWLEAELDAALRDLSVKRLGAPVLASFAFEAFPAGFVWSGNASALLPALHARTPVWPRS